MMKEPVAGDIVEAQSLMASDELRGIGVDAVLDAHEPWLFWCRAAALVHDLYSGAGSSEHECSL
jgi:hypothetical protein